MCWPCPRRRCVACALLTALCFGLAAARAHAADTTETWDAGATDIDFYLGLDGVGRAQYEKTAFGELMLGYGIVERFSAFLGAALESNEVFADGAGAFFLGIFGTPLDTDHVDLDLFFRVGAGGPGFSEIEVTPALELNVDAHPERRSWGLYLRAGVPLFGRDTGDTRMHHELGLRCEATVGAYYTLAGRHQLLLEHDVVWHPRPSAEDRPFEVGGLALGYNVTLSRAIELINQIYFDLPQAGEPAAFGVMSGFIATLPAARPR